jgi:hypothetical protein
MFLFGRSSATRSPIITTEEHFVQTEETDESFCTEASNNHNELFHSSLYVLTLHELHSSSAVNDELVYDESCSLYERLQVSLHYLINCLC